MHAVVRRTGGPTPSIAKSIAANQKLSSGGDGRLTRFAKNSRVCYLLSDWERDGVERTRSYEEACFSLVQSRAQDHGIAIAVDDDCDGYFFAMATIEGSLESPRPPPSIGVVGCQSGGQQRRRRGRPAGSIESASRFDAAGGSQAKAIV